MTLTRGLLVALAGPAVLALVSACATTSGGGAPSVPAPAPSTPSAGVPSMPSTPSAPSTGLPSTPSAPSAPSAGMPSTPSAPSAPSAGMPSTSAGSPAGSASEPAQTADERTAALDRRFDESLGEFDERLRKERERVARERDARESGEGAYPAGEDPYGEDGTGDASVRTVQAGSRPGDLKSDGSREQESDGSASPAGSGASGVTARERPDGSDDDVIARRLRRAAESETDPELKEKLWKEYEEYKRSVPGA